MTSQNAALIYRIGGTPTTPARIVIAQALNPAAKFCRAVRVEARTTVPLANPTNTFVRVHITCPDALYAELPPIPGPPPPAPYLGDPPIPLGLGYPDQPLIVFNASISFSCNKRAECGLLNIPSNMPPTSPVWYTLFPYVITLYAPVPITASITIQYS